MSIHKTQIRFYDEATFLLKPFFIRKR